MKTVYDEFNKALAQNKEMIGNLEQISHTENHGKHIIISISGYLSQNDELEQHWTKLIDNVNHATVYAFRWASQD